MKINISKKQYWELMRAVYMADWMANAICEGNMKQDDEIKKIRDYIFSFAKEFGYQDYAEYDTELEKYYATLDMDDEPSTRQLIERYDEHSTWDELAVWLGERDFFRKYTKQAISDMSREEYFTKSMECEIKWQEEFAEHGIERLEVNEDKK